MNTRGDFEGLVAKTRDFLTELADNNSRDWFYTHKARYDADLKRPAEALLEALTADISDMADAPVKPKLFRPHRDVRFSEDKTPYHTHLHMLWSRPDGCAWFFGIAPDYATAGVGIMRFDPDGLEIYREAVAGETGDELDDIAAASAARIDPPALKRVPAPYPADHPREEWLRRKQLVFWIDGLEPRLEPDPVAGLKDAFAPLTPLADWIAHHL